MVVITARAWGRIASMCLTLLAGILLNYIKSSRLPLPWHVNSLMGISYLRPPVWFEDGIIRGEFIVLAMQVGHRGLAHCHTWRVL